MKHQILLHEIGQRVFNLRCRVIIHKLFHKSFLAYRVTGGAEQFRRRARQMAKRLCLPPYTHCSAKT